MDAGAAGVLQGALREVSGRSYGGTGLGPDACGHWRPDGVPDATVQEVLKRLDPELARQVTEPDFTSGTFDSLRAVQHGLGILRDRDEWTANLAPDAPSLIADQFHLNVWAAAATLWDTGKYRVAVGQAAVSLSAHIAKKAASPLSERELVAQVFSPGEPGPNQLRLHFAGDKSSKTWRSCQEGLHLLAQGAFAGIRNVARIPTTSGRSRWRWSTWLSCPSWPGGPTRPRSSPAAKRPASRSQRGALVHSIRRARCSRRSPPCAAWRPRDASCRTGWRAGAG